jgi:hypothetical protein
MQKMTLVYSNEGGNSVFSVGTQWNPLQARLRELLDHKESFSEAMELVLRMHSLLHTRDVSGQSAPTLMDEVWENLSDFAFRTMPAAADVTVAWNIWHITRIEDLTCNLLMADGNQVLDVTWQTRLHTKVRDTGNAMTDEEIMSFSGEVDRLALQDYRDAVGWRVREVIAGLEPDSLKRTFSKRQVDRILTEGGLTTHPDSVWLLDFWGKKNVAGILLMPITRHQMGHLNDCLKLKEKCAKLLLKQARMDVKG